MHEYDFDEMARHFNAMRKSYLDYRNGGSQSVVEKNLSKYLALSDLFFRKYPNPFAINDKDYISQPREFNTRSGYASIEKKLKDYIELKENIESRILAFKRNEASGDVISRFEHYLSKCNEKIKVAETELKSISESNSPI